MLSRTVVMEADLQLDRLPPRKRELQKRQVDLSGGVAVRSFKVHVYRSAKPNRDYNQILELRKLYDERVTIGQSEQTDKQTDRQLYFKYMMRVNLQETNIPIAQNTA